jgi:probable HAF family extracellular repeat protein
MKITISAIAMIAWSGYALAGNYTVTQLGLLPGGTYTNASAINNEGQVVGYADDYFPNIFSQEISATIWNGTTPTLIAHGGFVFAGAAGINNSAVVVGSITYENFTTCPFAWSLSHGFFYLTTGCDPQGYANGVNDSGQIVGETSVGANPNVPKHATLWASPTTTNPTILPTLGRPRNTSSSAQGINAAGQIVGSSGFSDGTTFTQHATLWTGTNGAYVTDLGTLGGANSTANAINTGGHIVGWANTTGGDQHAAFWDRKKVRDLGTLGGKTSSANGINAGGYIVGAADTNNGGSHATLWMSARAKPIDLNSEIDSSLAITLTNAAGINDKCQIVANGTNNTTGAEVSFVLSPKHYSKCNHCERSDDWKAQSEHGADDSDCKRDDDGQDDGD